MQQNIAMDDDVPEDYVQPPTDASHELKGSHDPYQRARVGARLLSVSLLDLYELQRQRLEDEVVRLREERNTWLDVRRSTIQHHSILMAILQASIGLCDILADRKSMTTLKMLRVSPFTIHVCYDMN
jgi:hypothetical protein